MTNRIYAVGDIHGELGMLEEAISKIERDGGAEDRVVFIGDYIDRGPDSRGVIEFLMKGIASNKNWICLTGNHDQMFSMFMEDHPRTPLQIRIRFHWLHERIGGRETLASYGVVVDDNDVMQDVHSRARTSVPREHIDFLDSLPFFYEQEGLLFVHAGIRPGVPLAQQDNNDLLWIRAEFLEDTRTHPFLVVHGHTPVSMAVNYGNRVNLDSGAGYGNQLTTAVFEGRNCWKLTDSGRQPMLPKPL